MDNIYKLENDFSIVYDVPNTFSNKKIVKGDYNYKSFTESKMYEGFSKSDCFDSSGNPVVNDKCTANNLMMDISNNLSKLIGNPNKKLVSGVSTMADNHQYGSYQNSATEIDANYKQLEADINRYKEANKTSFLNDTIDNKGNLLYDNKEVDQTIRDGLYEDSKELLLQQNNMYLLGSFIASCVLVLMVVVK
jgi:hypothetical protein